MRNDAKHTPGPWVVDHDLMPQTMCIVHDEPSGLKTLVAEIAGNEYRDPGQFANAILIAAAPETAAELDRLKAELAELRKINQNNVNASQANHADATSLKALNAELLAALQSLVCDEANAAVHAAKRHLFNLAPEIPFAARAAIAKATGVPA